MSLGIQMSNLDYRRHCSWWCPDVDYSGWSHGFFCRSLFCLEKEVFAGFWCLIWNYRVLSCFTVGAGTCDSTQLWNVTFSRLKKRKVEVCVHVSLRWLSCHGGAYSQWWCFQAAHDSPHYFPERLQEMCRKRLYFPVLTMFFCHDWM